MEKRTILFFVITFMILYLWQYFAPKSQVPVDENNNTVIEEVVETKADLSVEASDSQTGTAVVTPKEDIQVNTDVKAKEITVETPLYIATLSNRGPAITGFKLKKYTTTIEPDSPLVELYSAGELLKNYISLYFNTPSLKNANNQLFQTKDDSFTLSQGEADKPLSFRHVTENGIVIEQVFTFSPDRYDIGVKVNIINRSENTVNGNINTVINNLPKSNAKYYSFIGSAVYIDNELEELDAGDLEDSPEMAGKIDWVAYENEYFISAVIPGEKEKSKYAGVLQPSTGIITTTHVSAPFDVTPSSPATKEYSLLLGPRDVNILKQFGHKLETAIDYGFFTVIAEPLHFLLNFFNKFINNFGFSIILLTILIKIIFWPLTQKSQKSMKQMQKLQPLMAKIREKYKDNREMMNKETMGLYRTYKVNPMSGCLPMLIQIPVFFALYRVLGSSIELRHAPFLLWINDLSTPDRLFTLPSWIPWIDPPGIPVLTLLMGASMFLQQKLQPMVGDPSQAKIMMFMPIIFTVMFINFPSGLVLYWLTQNILSIGQQYLINRKPD